jgi:hypothetical protein
LSELLYNQVNQVVNEVFFDGGFQGLPVYLDLEDEIVSLLSEKLNESPDAVEDILSLSVAETIDWSHPNIYHFHKANLLKWHKENFDEPPPFTALLLTLSLAAERMRDDGVYSANNYYERLAQVLHVTGRDEIQKLRQAGKNTLFFWKTLNLWLSQNDYAFGKPTARKVNSWTYVSYAISQSLVRDGDRKKFHKMFNHYGLSSSDQLTSSEIILYLHEWMGSGYVGGWLKKLWQNPDLRERVAYAALEELENWDESTDLTGKRGAKNKRLSWVVVLKSFPKPKISLFLSASGVDPEDVGVLKLDPESKGAASIAFENVGVASLAPLPGTEISFLGPTAEIKLDALMQSSLTLVSDRGDYTFSHDSRPIIPLLKVEGSTYFREVSRISLLAQHVIICHDRWIVDVKNYLDKYGRPGFSVIQGTGLNGLPSQWYLVSKVEIMNIVPSEDVNDNLQTLVPLSEGVNLHLGGGLKLATGIWHASSPPEVAATSDQGLMDVTFAMDKFGSSTQKVLHLEQANSFNPAFLRNLEVNLEGNNYSLFAGKKKRETQIGFRSANMPRRLVSKRDKNIAYIVGNKDAEKPGFSAEDFNDQGRIDILRGMCFSGNDVDQGENILDLEDSTLEIEIGISYEVEDKSQKYDTAEVAGSAESCIIRGYHVFVCEPYNGPGTTTSRVMRCKYCNAIQIAPKKKRKKQKNTSAVLTKSTNFQSTSSIKEDQTQKVSADNVLDAICYTGAGTWSSLESLLSTHVEFPWQAQEFSRNLVDLGFLDAQFSKSWNKPTYWNCPPSSLVINPESKVAYLSGFRSQGLVNDVKSAMSKYSNSIFVEESFMSPTVYKWVFESDLIEKIKEAVQSINDPFGRPVKVVRVPAYGIVSKLPLVSEMEKSLQGIYVDYESDVEKFDLYRGRWKKSKLNGKGVYRTIFAGRRYFYFDGDGNFKEGGQELIKLIGARMENVRLHGYDNANECFEAILGCAPPGLYRRALVSLTGDLPVVLKEESKIVYKSVPRKLAISLLSKLYN